MYSVDLIFNYLNFNIIEHEGVFEYLQDHMILFNIVGIFFNRNDWFYYIVYEINKK